MELSVFLDRWALTPDGASFSTPAARLQPVLTASGEAAMLKVSHETEERFGAQVMAWWGGEGAARVLAHEGDALLMERAAGNRSLGDTARAGADDEATRIVCAAAAELHRPRAFPPPVGLTPLEVWFRSLLAAQEQGGVLARCAEAARELLSDPREVVVLHGDLHHGNVLNFGQRGWLAIDPKGLLGERGFDFANLFCNPDRATALAPGRLARQAAVVAEAAGLERKRLLKWVLAWSGLSAMWMVEDGETETIDLSLAETALSAC
ncbi:MAG: 3'-kinase [Ancylobacter novellus]|uniref:3'-kinase n=1 Tax=Ancylobacter novellus TaxID=921 RepID=A0A2W5MCF0_ANCNO|nr:MAG: 3'-kinase [Ancylobacter novellus]